MTQTPEKNIKKLMINGKLLLDYIKDKKERLELNVYQKNARAISFYQREGFIIQCEGLDEATGEKEYTMLCQYGCGFGAEKLD